MNHLHFHGQLDKLCVVPRFLSEFLLCDLRYLVRKTLSIRYGCLLLLCILQCKFASLFFYEFLLELARGLKRDGNTELVLVFTAVILVLHRSSTFLRGTHSTFNCFLLISCFCIKGFLILILFSLLLRSGWYLLLQAEG